MTLQVHVYIEVADLERAIDFYMRGLGLKLRRRLDRDWVELQGAAIPIFLLSDRPSIADLGGRRVPRDFERHWTPVHLDFITDDLETAVRAICDAGGVLERDIQVREGYKMGNMVDPFGNGFDLIQFSAGGYDDVDSGSSVDG